MEIARTLEQPEVRDVLQKQGLTPAPTSPGRFGAFVRGEMERNGRIIRMLNLRME